MTATGWLVIVSSAAALLATKRPSRSITINSS